MTVYMPMPTRALIFDFDGLILETEASMFECLSDLFRVHGAELDMDAWSRNIGGNALGRHSLVQLRRFGIIIGISAAARGHERSDDQKMR